MVVRRFALCVLVGIAVVVARGPQAWGQATHVPKPASPSLQSGRGEDPQIAQLTKKSPLESQKEEEDDILILLMKLGTFVVSEEMIGFAEGTSLLLPLGEFTQALDLAITTDPGSGRAGGWFIKENRLFSLNISKQEVIIDGRISSYAGSLVKVRDDEIFVDVRLLAKWFPLDIEFNLGNLTISLDSREPFPIEQRLEREGRRSKLRQKGPATEFEYKPTPYKLISLPIIDKSSQYTFSSDESENIVRKQEYSFTAAADIAGLNGELFMSGSDTDYIAQARLELGRKDPEAQLLGPVGASEFSIGDISTPQIPLVANIGSGRGAQISSYPLNAPTEFDRITLDGDLLTGWEVELYRNEVLLNFASSGSNGRYEFTDIPLLFGTNVLKLIFYGPQGQTREEIRLVRVGVDQVKPGNVHYRLAVNQQNAGTLSGVNELTRTDQTEKTRFVTDAELGITKNLSVGASYTSIPSTNFGNHQNYLSASLRGFYGDVAGRLDTVKEIKGGWANKISGQTTLSGISLFGDYTRYFDFTSEKLAFNIDPVKDQTNLRVEGTANLPLLSHIPYSLTAGHERKASDVATTTIANRASFGLGPASLTNQLTWTYTDNVTTDTSAASGSLSLGGTVSSVRLRGSGSYTLDPNRIFSSASISGEWTMFQDFTGKAGVSRSFNGDILTTYTAGLNAHFDSLAVGTNVTYSHRGALEAVFTLTSSFGVNPRTGIPFTRYDRN